MSIIVLHTTIRLLRAGMTPLTDSMCAMRSSCGDRVVSELKYENVILNYEFVFIE